MGEVVKGVIVDLIAIMEFGKEVFKVVLVNIILIEILQFSEDAED
jgi:hypothetical protein